MKQGRSGRKAVAVLAVFNVVLLCVSIFCMIRTHRNTQKINQAERAFQYSETSDKVVLTLANGREAEIVFGKTAVRIIESYRYTESISEILLFVREYGSKHGYTLQRNNTELLGEFRLHTLLYRVGYKRAQTGDLDWDYEADPRWYVNAASRMLGACGI